MHLMKYSFLIIPSNFPYALTKTPYTNLMSSFLDVQWNW